MKSRKCQAVYRFLMPSALLLGFICAQLDARASAPDSPENGLSLTNLVFNPPAILAPNAGSDTISNFHLAIQFNQDSIVGDRPWGGHLEQLSGPQFTNNIVSFAACWRSDLKFKISTIGDDDGAFDVEVSRPDGSKHASLLLGVLDSNGVLQKKVTIESFTNSFTNPQSFTNIVTLAHAGPDVITNVIYNGQEYIKTPPLADLISLGFQIENIQVAAQDSDNGIDLNLILRSAECVVKIDNSGPVKKVLDISRKTAQSAIQQ